MARRNRRNSADIAPTKDNRDKAEAMAAYARQAKDNDLIEKATEIRVRAQRKAGEMLRQAAQSGMRSTGGVANLRNQSSESQHATPTLAEIGLTKSESSRYQQLAAMPAEHFDLHPQSVGGSRPVPML